MNGCPVLVSHPAKTKVAARLPHVGSFIRHGGLNDRCCPAGLATVQGNDAAMLLAAAVKGLRFRFNLPEDGRPSRSGSEPRP